MKMSLFGSLLGDFEDESIFAHHMRSMRQMNSIMNSLMPSDPFGSPFDLINGTTQALATRNNRNNSLMPFGFPSLPLNRLISGAGFGDNGGAAFHSSSFVSMTQGPDGRPQVYQATSSTKSGPGGVRETKKTVQDSRTGVKKMAIGHHIGERAHIIEREKNMNEGTEEERQDFINLDEEEAEDFNKEFESKVRSVPSICGTNPTGYKQSNMLALPAPPVSSSNTTSRRLLRNVSMTSPRLRTPTSSPLALSSTGYAPSLSSSIHPHPYPSAARRQHRSKKASRVSKATDNN